MIQSLEVLVWVLCFTAPLYWAIPLRFQTARLALLVVVSLLLLAGLSPVIPLIVGGYALAVVASIGALRCRLVSEPTLKAVSWGLFLPLVLPETISPQRLVEWLLDGRAPPAAIGWSYLGLSYTAISAFLIMRQAIASNCRPLSALMALSFFATHAAGPIVGSGPYEDRARAARASIAMLLTGTCRIGWGVMLVSFAAPAAMAWSPQGLGSAAAAWLHVYSNFLHLYLDFAGYTDVAIGTALIYGIRLPENFRLPLLSRSVQEFWQRWHLTLSGFIGTYLFKPLVRTTGRPPFAIFAAFVAAGLWHRVSLLYLFWGFGHGAALALQMTARKRGWIPDRFTKHPVVQLLSWFLTITYIALLSAIANAADLAAAITLVRRLAGG